MPRVLLMLAPAVVSLAGCGGTTAKPKPVAPVAPAASLTPIAPVTPSTPPAEPAKPTAALQRLKDNPASELLTPAFIKALTGREGGSAEWAAGIYTREIADKLEMGEATSVGEGSATLVIAPAGKQHVLARVVPTADGPRFAWLQLIPAGPTVSPRRGACAVHRGRLFKRGHQWKRFSRGRVVNAHAAHPPGPAAG